MSELRLCETGHVFSIKTPSDDPETQYNGLVVSRAYWKLTPKCPACGTSATVPVSTINNAIRANIIGVETNIVTLI